MTTPNVDPIATVKLDHHAGHAVTAKVIPFDVDILVLVGPLVVVEQKSSASPGEKERPPALNRECSSPTFVWYIC